MKLASDLSYDDFVDQLEMALRSIVDWHREREGVDLDEQLLDGGRVLSLDDEYGPISGVNEIERTFRSATVHMDLAKQARAEGAHELAWSRVAFASRLIGRVHGLESAVLEVKRRKEINVDLKAKAIELLSCMRPSAGWTKDVDAYEAIAGAFEAYRSELEEGQRKAADPVDLVAQWKKNDPLVRAAIVGNGAGRLLEEFNRSKKLP